MGRTHGALVVTKYKVFKALLLEEESFAGVVHHGDEQQEGRGNNSVRQWPANMFHSCSGRRGGSSSEQTTTGRFGLQHQSHWYANSSPYFFLEEETNNKGAKPNVPDALLTTSSRLKLRIFEFLLFVLKNRNFGRNKRKWVDWVTTTLALQTTSIGY